MLIGEVAEFLKKVPTFQFPDDILSQVNLKPIKLPICQVQNDFNKERRINACYRSFHCFGCTLL